MCHPLPRSALTLPAASDVSREVPTSPPIFQAGSLGPTEGAHCSTDPAPALLHCPDLRLLQRLAPVPLHICSVLRAGRLRETCGFWLRGGFSICQLSPNRLQPQEGTGRGCSSRNSMGAGTQQCRATRLGLIPAGSHLSRLLISVQKPLTQQPPLPGAAPRTALRLQPPPPPPTSRMGRRVPACD